VIRDTRILRLAALLDRRRVTYHVDLQRGSVVNRFWPSRKPAK